MNTTDKFTVFADKVEIDIRLGWQNWGSIRINFPLNLMII
jgi:hypothetical protein